jgi:hypothetical protein
MQFLIESLSHVSNFRLSILLHVCFYICFVIIHGFHDDTTDNIFRFRIVQEARRLPLDDHVAKICMYTCIYTYPWVQKLRLRLV